MITELLFINFNSYKIFTADLWSIQKKIYFEDFKLKLIRIYIYTIGRNEIDKIYQIRRVDYSTFECIINFKRFIYKIKKNKKK